MTSLNTLNQNPLQELLPPFVGQWYISDTSRSYSGEEIFDYMDGAGEIYLSYNFKDLTVQRYKCTNQEEILAEIFDMGSPENSFGLFTYMQNRGPKVQIGQDGEYKNGLLCFWKGKYFVCVSIDRENEKAKNAVLELGKYVSQAIKRVGEKPKILSYMPKGKYFQNSLRYFYGYEILNIHFYIADRNILNLNKNTECVLIRMKSDKSYLLLVKYTNQDRADSSYNNFLMYYMPDTQSGGVVKTENKKWTACVKHRNYLILVFDAQTKKGAITSIESLKERLP